MVRVAVFLAALVAACGSCQAARTCSNSNVAAEYKSCKCIIDDPGQADHGYTVDLTPLSGTVFNFASPSYSYIWSMCKPVPDAPSRGGTCTTKFDAAACQLDVAAWRCTGKQSPAVFSYNAADSTLTVTYSGGESAGTPKPANRQTLVALKCDPSATVSTVKVVAEQGLVYDFMLTSNWSCPREPAPPAPTAPPAPPGKQSKHGLSVGSVMTIIFFVLLIVYLVGGVVYLRAVRGAEGVEMMPNYSFWILIPSLVKDGVVFLLSLCRKEKSGYETI